MRLQGFPPPPSGRQCRSPENIPAFPRYPVSPASAPSAPDYDSIPHRLRKPRSLMLQLRKAPRPSPVRQRAHPSARSPVHIPAACRQSPRFAPGPPFCPDRKEAPQNMSQKPFDRKTPPAQALPFFRPSGCQSTSTGSADSDKSPALS